MKVSALAGTAVIGSALIAAGFFVRSELKELRRPPTPPLPPLIAGAGAGGPFFHRQSGADNIREQPQSPEIAARLAAVAPPGSPAKALREVLAEQGFSVEVPCRDDPSLRLATFRQRPGGGLTYAGFAQIWWQEDVGGRIAWTSGNIAYTGL